MRDAIKFSVIIPAYNCENTISEAISSVLSQDYLNFEIIVVNDGSTDSTAARVAEFTDKRIRLLNIENSGPANARNAGIMAANGDYLMFLDSDDTYRSGIFDVMSYRILKYNCDIVILGFAQYIGEESVTYGFGNTYADDITMLKSIAEIYSKNVLNQVWNKAFRLSLIRNESIRFKDYRFGEDRLFVAEVLKIANGICIGPETIYNYRTATDSSLVSSYYDKKFSVCNEIAAAYSELNFLATGSSQNEELSFMYIKSVLSCMTVLYSPSCSLTSREKREEIKKIVNSDEIKKYLTVPNNHGGALKFIARIILSGSAGLNVILSKFVVFARKHFKRLFLSVRG